MRVPGSAGVLARAKGHSPLRGFGRFSASRRRPPVVLVSRTRTRTRTRIPCAFEYEYEYEYEDGREAKSPPTVPSYSGCGYR
ncbi:MAG: hypothetical protein HZA54_02600 [Planctomycetes bacterium]|nr:hypothetical protein [Planctomycetota bacterium]